MSEIFKVMSGDLNCMKEDKEKAEGERDRAVGELRYISQ